MDKQATWWRWARLPLLLGANLCAMTCLPRVKTEDALRCASGVRLEPGVSPPKVLVYSNRPPFGG